MKKAAQVECAKKAEGLKAEFPAQTPQCPPRKTRQHPRDSGADGDEPQRVHHLNPVELVPQQELLGFPDLQLMGVPYSKPHIWRLVKAGQFPKPIKFGTGQNCRCLFRRADILEWIERRRAA